MPDAYAVAPYIYGSSIAAMKASLPEIDQQLADQRAAVPTGIDLITYEGGQHDAQSGPTTSADPGIYDVYTEYMTILAKHVSLFVAYNLNQPWGGSDAWGVVDEDLSQDSHKLRAIRDWIASH